METKINLNTLGKLNEDEAREILERLRWADGVVCPHCNFKGAYKLKPRDEFKTHVRKGVYKCKQCKKQFTVTVGTIFEGSHIKISVWLKAIYLMCSSKKGISASQLQRMLGITIVSAWFMAHRIRYAMEQSINEKLKGIVEADETYIGGKAKGKRGRGAKKKMVIASLVERGRDVRSVPIENLTAKKLKGFIRQNVDDSAYIMTDDFRSYSGLHKEFAGHGVINHGAKEYCRGIIHTNTIEGYFSILKRGVNGIFHHISKKHLPFYLNEFDFRYNSRKLQDGDRTINAIKGFENKRLFYRDSSGVA